MVWMERIFLYQTLILSDQNYGNYIKSVLKIGTAVFDTDVEEHSNVFLSNYKMFVKKTVKEFHALLIKRLLTKYRFMN